MIEVELNQLASGLALTSNSAAICSMHGSKSRLISPAGQMNIHRNVSPKVSRSWRVNASSTPTRVSGEQIKRKALPQLDPGLDDKLSSRRLHLDEAGYFVISIDASSRDIVAKYFPNTINSKGTHWSMERKKYDTACSKTLPFLVDVAISPTDATSILILRAVG